MESCKGSAFLHAVRRGFPALFCVAAALLPVTAAADSIKGFMEFDFGSSQAKSTNPSGATASSSSNLFLQRYNIGFTKNLFPLISLEAGGIFENILASGRSAGVSSSGSDTQISPFVNLSWQEHTFPVNLGYQRREQRSESNGVVSPTQIMESYSASLGWKPLELPPWGLQYLKTNLYDKERTLTDTSADSFQWGTNYTPVAGFDFSYQGSYLRNEDHLVLSESDFLSHSGRVSYAGQFFKNRVSLASSYNVAVSTNSFSNAGQGVNLAPVLALNGALFGVTSPTSPVRVDSGSLAPSTNTFNVNIISAVPPLPGTQDNFGLDFARPVSVSTLYLPVVSGAFSRPSNLSRVAGLFPWSIYTSDDNLTWTLSQAITTPSFGPDPIGASDTVGFILNLTPVTKRYVKVVVTPVQRSDLAPFLPIPDIDPSSVTVAGLQAFSVQSQGARTSSSLGGSYALSASARILDNPNLNYEMNFSLNHGSSEGTSSMSYNLSNGLSASHRFNEVFSGMARLSYNTSSTQGSPATNTFNASAALTAAPLPTLSHSLVYSSQIGYTGSQIISSNSLFINNTMQLYRGAALLVSAGFSESTDPAGRTSDSTILNAGLSLSPHRTVNLNINYGQTASKATGGGLPDVSGDARFVASSATYNPFESVYFSGRWALSQQQNQPTSTSQNYVAAWSPFAGGALQLSFSYNDSVSLPQDSRERGVSSSVQWAIRPGMTLDTSYVISRSTAPTGNSDLNSLSMTLRIAL